MSTGTDYNHRRRPREASGKDVESINTTQPVPAKGQPLALEERLDYGSKSWEDVQRDRNQYVIKSSVPPCTSARTTFYAWDADDADEKQYDVLFCLQHGRQHPAEPRIEEYSEPWGGQKVRQEDVFTYCRADTILSRAEVTGFPRERAVRRTVRENLNGFSRYYEGADGAAIGFATLYMYDSRQAALDSYLVDEAERMLDVDGKKLVAYVWREYGGGTQ